MQLICLNVLVIIVFILLPPSDHNVSGQLLSFDNKQGFNNTDNRSISSPSLRRAKRYLDFTKGSRMSWRTTVKNNILKVNTLWAYGFGVRVNFPFPDKNDRKRPFFKRDVFQSLTDVLDGNGLDGQACILKSFCAAHLDAEGELSGGMLFKLLKYIFTAQGGNCTSDYTKLKLVKHNLVSSPLSATHVGTGQNLTTFYCTYDDYRYCDR